MEKFIENLQSVPVVLNELVVMTSILPFLIISSTILATANGCGSIPAGREKTVSFAVTDFKLPARMVYSDEMGVTSKVLTTTTKSGAETFVEEILYEQGRSAFLPDTVISSILQQLDVQITYDPFKCEFVVNEPFKGANNGAMANILNCIIVDETVTSTCMNAVAAMCNMPAMLPMNSKPVESKYLSISGSIKTSNVVMANWSDQMWQSVLNRVLRRITSTPIGSRFYGATVNLR